MKYRLFTLMLITFLMHEINSVGTESYESVYEETNGDNDYTVSVIIEGDILKWLKCHCTNVKKCSPNNFVYLLR